MVKHQCNGRRGVTPPQHGGVTHIDCLHKKRDRSKLKTSDGVRGNRWVSQRMVLTIRKFLVIYLVIFQEHAYIFLKLA